MLPVRSPPMFPLCFTSPLCLQSSFNSPRFNLCTCICLFSKLHTFLPLVRYLRPDFDSTHGYSFCTKNHPFLCLYVLLFFLCFLWLFHYVLLNKNIIYVLCIIFMLFLHNFYIFFLFLCSLFFLFTASLKSPPSAGIYYLHPCMFHDLYYEVIFPHLFYTTCLLKGLCYLLYNKFYIIHHYKRSYFLSTLGLCLGENQHFPSILIFRCVHLLHCMLKYQNTF